MKYKAVIDRKAVGKELRKYRKDRGIRQDFIAKKLRVDSSKLCRMESGDFGPWSLKFIARWREALGLPPQVKATAAPKKKKAPATAKKRK